MENPDSKENFSEELPEKTPEEIPEDIDTIENKYKVVSVLGKGKTSTVYLVKHLFLDKQLAIKLFKDKYWENQKRFARAQREAMNCASIEHKNVVKVYDFGVTEAGAPYIVQEYISGTNLRSLIMESGPLERTRAIEIFKQVARGINCLHENQILHRDIKSENIVITKGAGGKEVVKLIDLGIARQEDKDGAIQSLTQSGQHIGSPYYISPELCHGSKIDHRSDIYSFGCVMYEVLSGNPPFRSESVMKTLEMHLNSEPKSLQSIGVPEALDDLILKCLAKAPEDRFEDCKEILATLDEFKTKTARKTDGDPSAPTQADEKSDETGRPATPKKIRLGFSTILNCVLVVLLIIASLLYMNERGPTKSHEHAGEKSPHHKKAKVDGDDDSSYKDQFAQTLGGQMFDRLTIPKKSDRVFEQAMKTARARNASPEELCMIAELRCSMLLSYKRWKVLNTVATEIEESLKEVEDKLAANTSKEAKSLGNIPILYQELSYSYLEQGQIDKAKEYAKRGLALVAKHPDAIVLTPMMNMQMALCLGKEGDYKKALELAKASEKELAKRLGPGHPKTISALLTESKIHEHEENFKDALKCAEAAYKNIELSPVPLNTDYFQKRIKELSDKLKKAK